MRVQVLGCSGGIGGQTHRTTALWLDGDVLIDCGTGVSQLELSALVSINHVFLTHAHLDHIAFLPLLIDAVAESRESPLTVWARAETLAALRQHVFNWQIWPDFSVLPSAQAPALVFREVAEGESIHLNGRQITALPAAHSIPALGYLLASPTGSLAFSGDTGFCPALVEALRQVPNLQHLIVETSFVNAQARLADVSGHLCPQVLGKMLALLEPQPQTWITHLKPGGELAIMTEIAALGLEPPPLRLQTEMVFDF